MAIPAIISQPQPGIGPNVDKNQSPPTIMQITAIANKIVPMFSTVSDIFSLQFIDLFIVFKYSYLANTHKIERKARAKVLLDRKHPIVKT
jgi:hypothetical protein